MDLEQRLANLEDRISKLEEIERKRRTFEIIKTVLRVIILIATVIFAVYAYKMIQEKIAPYQEIVKEYNDFNIQDIIDSYLK